MAAQVFTIKREELRPGRDARTNKSKDERKNNQKTTGH